MSTYQNDFSLLDYWRGYLPVSGPDPVGEMFKKEMIGFYDRNIFESNVSVFKQSINLWFHKWTIVENALVLENIIHESDWYMDHEYPDRRGPKYYNIPESERDMWWNNRFGRNIPARLWEATRTRN